MTWKENKRRKEQKRITKTTPKQCNKMTVSTYLSIITLNVNGLNDQSKDRVGE